jgi:quinol monooxygenase YgiN
MEMLMIKLAFFARFEAKPGKEKEVAKFLETALDMVKKEPTTINWYALRLCPVHSVYSIPSTTRLDARGTSTARLGRR